MRRHIKPTLGRLALDKVEPLHVRSLMNRKLRDGLSPKSVRYIRETLDRSGVQAITSKLGAEDLACSTG